MGLAADLKQLTDLFDRLVLANSTSASRIVMMLCAGENRFVIIVPAS